MSAHYTIVQYVPDPTADERVNFGVITWDDEQALSRFVGDWRRVKAFGGEDVRFLKEFARSISEKTSGALRLPELGDEIQLQALKKMVAEWSYSIQFTDPRGSLKNAEALLGEVSGLFLRELPKPVRRHARTRKAAVRIAHDSLFTAIQERAADEVEEIVKRNETVEGFGVLGPLVGGVFLLVTHHATTGPARRLTTPRLQRPSIERHDPAFEPVGLVVGTGNATVGPYES